MFQKDIPYQAIDEHFAGYPYTANAVRNVYAAGIFGRTMFFLLLIIFLIREIMYGLDFNDSAQAVGLIAGFLALFAMYFLPTIPLRRLGDRSFTKTFLYLSMLFAIPGCLSIIGIWYLYVLIKAAYTFDDYYPMFDYN